MEEKGVMYAWPPLHPEAPLNNMQSQRDGDYQQHWTNFDNSVNAVSFGFVATAILIFMFLIMALFEKFLRSDSPATSPSDHRRRHFDVESQMGSFHRKLEYSSPKMSVYAHGVSVLMPGDEIPTFLARPAPIPCPPERISWPPH